MNISNKVSLLLLKKIISSNLATAQFKKINLPKQQVFNTYLIRSRIKDTEQSANFETLLNSIEKSRVKTISIFSILEGDKLCLLFTDIKVDNLFGILYYEKDQKVI